MRWVKHCPQCGARLEQRPVGERMRPVCPACGFIYYLNPVVAAGTLVEQDSRIVLVRRGVEPGRGLWGLPAGYVEADESVEEAAIRETREECGLIVELDGLLGVYSFGAEGDARGVLILYAAHVIGGALRAGDDALEVGWFTLETLPPDDQIAFQTHRQALHEWSRARAITYRLATPEQAAIAQEISRTYKLPDRDLIADAAGPESALLVALDRGRVVGFADVTFHRDEGLARLHQVFVLPHYRRWGIGTALIRQAVAFTKAQGLVRLLTEVDANNVGIGAYLKAGFRTCGFLNLGSSKDRAILFLAHDLTSEGPEALAGGSEHVPT